jgi:2-C-methyl-D-erythritol 2,4-cyclodiphosphate synthase
MLGGVRVPYEKGLAGHSDADVLVHSIMDALLGAAALGDIGRHFPPTDNAYKDISSLDLLERVSHLLTINGWLVVNVDATIIAESPRLSPFIKEMEVNIQGRIAGRPIVNVKATTTEGMGFTGRGEGIASMSAALISRNKED